MMLRSLKMEGSNVRVPVSSRGENLSGLAIKVLLAFVSAAEYSPPCRKNAKAGALLSSLARAFFTFLFYPPHSLLPSTPSIYTSLHLNLLHHTSAKFTPHTSTTHTLSHQSTSCLTAVVVTAARAAAAAAAATLAAGTTPRDPMDKALTATIQPVALMMGTILNKSLLGSACSYPISLSTSPQTITNVQQWQIRRLRRWPRWWLRRRWSGRLRRW
jgi:hypothetical protein